MKFFVGVLAFIKEFVMFKNSQRSHQRRKAKFPRLQRLMSKRTQAPLRGQWFTTADEEGNVQIHPNR